VAAQPERGGIGCHSGNGTVTVLQDHRRER